jgi:hypothetical protein
VQIKAHSDFFQKKKRVGNILNPPFCSSYY